MAALVAGIIRHGHYEQPPDTPSAHLLYPLTEKGRAQARAAVEEIAGTAGERGWEIASVIDTSSLLRAWETATLLAEGLGARLGKSFSLEIFDDLAERGLGAAANLTESRIEAILERDPRFEVPETGWKRSSEYRLPFPGAESLWQAGDRVAAFLRSRMGGMNPASRDTLKIFVGHGGAFRHAAARLGTVREEEVAGLSMYHCKPVYLDASGGGSWTRLGGEWKIRESEERPD